MAGSGNTYLQSATGDNILCIEGENATDRVAGVSDSWDVTANANFVGSSGVHCLPDDGSAYTTGGDADAAVLEFSINFQATGTHYLWVRTDHSSTENTKDSFHIRLGAGSWTAYNDIRRSIASVAGEWIDGPTGGGTMSFTVSSTGVQTFYLQEREDGFRLDRILLTTNSGYDPNTVSGGDGPAESSVDGGGGGSSIPVYMNHYRNMRAA